MLARAEKYANAEERFKNRNQEKREPIKGKKKKDDGRERRVVRPDPSLRRDQFRPGERSEVRDTRPRLASQFTNFTELNTPRDQIHMQVRNLTLFRTTTPMRTNPSRRNLNKYCHFHKNHGHDTSECFELKEQIESLVR